METKEISVIMSIYNEPIGFIRQSVQSILQQTFSDFEFIIIVDGVDSDGVKYVRRIAEHDDRITLIYNETNLGLTKSLNKAVAQACGKYIARMDADDISLRNRLEVQYQYMENHPDVAVCGSLADSFDDQGNHSLLTLYDDSNQDISRVRMMFTNAGVIHPTAFLRRSFLTDNNITYNEKIAKAQDYAFWLDIMVCGGKIITIEQILLKYRLHNNQITRRQADNQTFYFLEIQRQQLKKIIPDIDDNLLAVHKELNNFSNQIEIRNFDGYIKTLIEGNQVFKEYDDLTFRKELMYRCSRCFLKSIFIYRDFKYLSSMYLKSAFSIEILLYSLKLWIRKMKRVILYKRYLWNVESKENNLEQFC